MGSGRILVGSRSRGQEVGFGPHPRPQLAGRQCISAYQHLGRGFGRSPRLSGGTRDLASRPPTKQGRHLIAPDPAPERCAVLKLRLGGVELTNSGIRGCGRSVAYGRQHELSLSRRVPTGPGKLGGSLARMTERSEDVAPARADQDWPPKVTGLFK